MAPRPHARARRLDAVSIAPSSLSLRINGPKLAKRRTSERYEAAGQPNGQTIGGRFHGLGNSSVIGFLAFDFFLVQRGFFLCFIMATNPPSIMKISMNNVVSASPE